VGDAVLSRPATAGGANRVESTTPALRGRRLCRILAVILLAAAEEAGAAERITVRAEPPVLTWSLFRRVDSIAGTAEDAHLAAEMSFPEPLAIESKDGRHRLPSFAIRVAPEPTRTVVRRSIGSPSELLRHEQGHYEIVVLVARALAEELEAITASSATELSRRVEERVTEHTARARRLSEAYDRETDRSRDTTAQARWNALIADALRAREVTHLAGLPL
jgi:hypothetical protein